MSCRRRDCASSVARFMDPLPFWYDADRRDGRRPRAFPVARDHSAPDGDVPFVGLAECVAPPDPLGEPDLHASRSAMELGIEDEDWVWVESHNGNSKCRARLMDGVNPHTVWTWNAIGKRSGAWALDKDAPESRTGFLLNHLISEYLPADQSGSRTSNPIR